MTVVSVEEERGGEGNDGGKAEREGSRSEEERHREEGKGRGEFGRETVG